MWSLLLVTLPTQPNAVRLRIWRALKALGCVALRDGAYVLPASEVAVLEALATEVGQHGGSASVMALSPKDKEQELDVLAQFDRAEAYAAWTESVKLAFATCQTLSETEARKRLRTLGETLQEIRRTDYYPRPGPTGQGDDSLLALLRQTFDARFSKGEPTPTVAATLSNILRLDPVKFQGKRWATRARPWVDRLASAWLIQRFIDPKAQFVWLDDPAKVPKTALGFDYDGARFTHVGQRVTFEVLMASFGLDADARLQHIAKVVHYLDVGGIPADQAAGLEAVLGGLREVHANDDALIQATGAVFDALYANAGRAAPSGENKP